MISGSYPPMKDGVDDYTQKLFEALQEQLGDAISLITTETVLSKGSRDERGPWGFVPRWDCRATRVIIRALREVRPDAVYIQYRTHGYEKRPEINLLPLILKMINGYHWFGAV